MRVLALDCATEHCSAALWLHGTVTERSAPPARGLSEHLLEWVSELLSESAIGPRGLDLIAFGRGPGAFTGVRLAASLAQGLALAAQLPVAPVSTLRAVAARALATVPQAAEVLVCQDARMHEVYWARFARDRDTVQMVGTERLDAPDAVDVRLGHGAIAAGSGFVAYPSLAQAWRVQHGGTPGCAEPLDCPPRARDIARLAVHDGLGAAVSAGHALPVYLRDKVASPAVTQAL